MKSTHYQPIIKPIAKNGSDKFGFKLKTVFNFINTRFEIEISGKTLEEIVLSHTYGLSPELNKYWQEVKQEILKL